MALSPILAALLADAVAVVQPQAVFQSQRVFETLRVSLWGILLLGELAVMFLLALACGAGLLAVFAPLSLPDPPGDLTPAEAIDDLWVLVRLAAGRLGQMIAEVTAGNSDPGYSRGRLGQMIAEITAGINDPGYSVSDRLFARLGWVNPRNHPWRFAVVLSLLAGVGLFTLHFREGLPPNLRIGLILAGFIIGGESLAALLGFALLGGYLGLRPHLIDLTGRRY